MYMCLCVWVPMEASGFRSSGAGAMDGCEPPDLGAGDGT